MGARDVLTRPRRPLVCKASLFELYHQITANQGRLSSYVKPLFCQWVFLRLTSFLRRRPQTYYEAKHGAGASVYQSARAALREGDGAPFVGWPVKKNNGLELFTISRPK